MGRTENPARAQRERVRIPFHEEDENIDDRQHNFQDDETSPNSPTTSRATNSYAPSSDCASPPLQSSSPPRRPLPPPPSSSSRAAATKRTRHEVGLLRQLGLNEDLTVCGADHVKQLSGRVRNAKKKRKHFHNHQYATLTRWDDVPQEVQARICQRMTLYDTYVARLAGLSSSSPSLTSTSTSSTSSSNNQTLRLFLADKDQNQIDNDHDNEQHPLRRRFIESVRQVQPLRDMWISQRTKARRMVLSPAEFCNLTQLRITKGFEFIPDSQQQHVVFQALQHLPNLRHLSLVNVHGLPSSLGACEERLVDVSLTHGQFPVVPAVVMRMRNVRRLTLDLSPQLQHVPEGLGEALTKLQVFSVVGCPRLKELPTDVLDTIERNARARKRVLVEKFRGSAAAAAGRTAGGGNRVGHKDDGKENVAEEDEIERRVFGKGLVLLSVEHFDQSFIQHTFVQSRYPNIVKGMKLTRAGAPPGDNNDNAPQQQQLEQQPEHQQGQEGQGQQNEAQAQLGGNDEELDDVDLDNLDGMF